MFSLRSPYHKSFNTEITEDLRELRVEALRDVEDTEKNSAEGAKP